MTIQFETSLKKTHNLGIALLRVCAFCSEKRYEQPTYAVCEAIVKPYLEYEDYFTKAQFDEAMVTLESFDEVAHRSSITHVAYTAPPKRRRSAPKRKRRKGRRR